MHISMSNLLSLYCKHKFKNFQNLENNIYKMSSDSDDDYYAKIAQKLQSMKSNYQENKVPTTTNLLQDSFDITVGKDLTTYNNKLPVVDLLKQTDIDTDDITEVTLDSIIEQNSKKCKTRTRTKKTDDNYIPDEPVRRGRRRSSKRIMWQDTQRLAAHLAAVVSRAEASINGNSSTGRGRGSTPSRRRGGRAWSRGRGGRKTNQRNIQNYSSSDNRNFAHYNVGNTDDYEDLSEQQDLFSATPAEVIQIDDSLNNTLDDPLDENEELSVKVYWQSCEINKFTIRRYQKLTLIYDYFSSKENVTREKLFFTYNDKMLNADDTPDSINYNIGKFIDGGVVNQSLSPLKKKYKQDVINGIKLKFQCQNVKKPYETVIDAVEKLSVAFMKCAEHFEKPLEKLKFYFDGDLISGKNTAKDLELEGGECIDVVIIS